MRRARSCPGYRALGSAPGALIRRPWLPKVAGKVHRRGRESAWRKRDSLGCQVLANREEFDQKQFSSLFPRKLWRVCRLWTQCVKTRAGRQRTLPGAQ